MFFLWRSVPAAVTVAFVLLLSLHDTVARCPNLCSGNGVCDHYLRCTCYDGWMGADCSLRTCPVDVAWSSSEASGTDQAHLPMECSNRGMCDRATGQCKCMAGFTGIACQRTSCAHDCHHHGRCLSLYEYARQSMSQDSKRYSYDKVWDARKLYGCVCDDGFHGFDCSLQTCPQGDDPLTTGQVNEMQVVKCVASGGSFVLYFRGQPSLTIATASTDSQVKAALEAITALGPNSVSVTFTSGSQACTLSGSNVIQIEFLQNFGPLPPLVAYETSLTTGGYIEIAASTSSYVVDDRKVMFRPRKGSKEDKVCSNRGVCDTSEGSCNCFDTNGDTYASSDGTAQPGVRGDCGYAKTTIAHCPGEVSCSGHGKCNSKDKTYRCDCADGWTGGDCSERVCPSGLSWFSYPTSDNTAHQVTSECSDRGLCDRETGDCACDEGFFGAACEYMACDGGVDEPCSGHGKCLSMSELVLVSTANGDATGYTYGSDPNNAYTWDGPRVHGCHCDAGYEGYDCSLRSCPKGDDPSTYNQDSETQVLQCLASNGTFTLTFRQHTTGPLPWNATVPLVSRALNQLPSIKGGVEVAFSGGPGLACSSNSLMMVTFFAVFGDVPALQADTSLLVNDGAGGALGSGTVRVATDGDSISTSTSVRGTRENDVCSNRGLCDASTGLCQCFLGFSSSDGKFSEGSLGECGYRVPMRTAYTTAYT